MYQAKSGGKIGLPIKGGDHKEQAHYEVCRIYAPKTFTEKGGWIEVPFLPQVALMDKKATDY
jgi:hypothetical protein